MSAVTEDPPAVARRPNQMATAIAREITPIDWGRFWSTDVPPEEWVVEPIVPARRQVAIYSPAKLGKSLLALEIAVSAATGRSVLGNPAQARRSVVYFDFEMTEEDVRERLVDLGYGPEDDLSLLAYYQLPSLPPLDTERGGQVLEEIVGRHGAELGVLDTMARVVQGAEDESDTYRAFYAHSGVRLKRLGVALLRLDHAGKDLTRGQRGSSGKADDVDVVFRLGVVEDKVVLTRTHSRVPWVPAEVALQRQTEPVLRHVRTDGGWPSGTKETADLLDDLGVPLDATVTAAIRAFKVAGRGRRRQVVAAGLKWRKIRSGTVPGIPGTASETVDPVTAGTALDDSEESQLTVGTAVPGTAGNRGGSTTGTTCPPLGGHGPGTSPDEPPTPSDDDLRRWLDEDEPF
jgi:hypothetical protein